MALSHGLAQAGTPPEKLDVDATVTSFPGTGITKSALAVRGIVPGIDEPAFLDAAEDAKENCPVSKALASVPEITLEASLRVTPRYPPAMAIERLVDELDRSYAEAQERMSDPAVYNDHRQAADAGRRLKELETPKRLADAWRESP